MMRTTTAALALAVSASMAAQPAPTTLDSYSRARRLVDLAVAAHGGVDALRAARQVRVTSDGHDVWRHQSRRPAPPYDRERFTSDLHVDLANGRLVNEETRTYPGGAHRHYSFITSGERSFSVNHRRRSYTVEDYPPAATQTGNLYYLPQLVLLAAHESGLGLRALGRVTLASGASVEAIATTADGNSLTIGLDPETHLLRALLAVRSDAVEGVSAAETEFLSYRTLDGMLMPERRVRWAAGEVTQDVAYVRVVGNYQVPDAAVEPAAGYEKLSPVPPPMVRALAPGVWLVGGNAASLVVAMDDHVIVVDAAPAIAAQVAQQVASLAPGKPIRYVVPTHHHDDHAPGVRTLAQPGTTVVTTAGNKAGFERLSTAPVEIVRGSRVWSSNGRTLELHDIGPSPHAAEMLVAWLPADGILFQADLIDLGGADAVRPGTNNETTVHFARWLAGRSWKVRTYAGGHGGVVDDEGFLQILAQPVTQ